MHENGADMKKAQLVVTFDPHRFKIPLYTVGEAARIVDVHPSTLSTWTRPYRRAGADGQPTIRDPTITRLRPERPRYPCIPFVGLVEAMVLAAVRRSGAPMQRIRPALKSLEQEIGLRHALASRRLYTDGAELLYDYAEKQSGTRESKLVMHLVVVRSGQGVFTEAVMEYLRRIEYAPDGYAYRIRVPAYTRAEVVADPEMSFGSPIFVRGGCRVDDVLHRFWAGESIKDLEKEFGVPPDHLEDVVRVTSRRPA